MKIKLPKQWRHWCYRLGLRVDGITGQEYWRWYYLQGRGRYFRVNESGTLDISVPDLDFDRWANSATLRNNPIPKTYAEFEALVARQGEKP